MMGMKLRIRKWAEFQHYKDRCPPWIKLHFKLLSSKDWVVLDDASRILAIASMLLASQSDDEPGVFEADPEYVRRVAYLNSAPDFKPLIDCGFLEVVQADASACKQTQAKATTETETETETEPPIVPQPKKSKARAMTFAAWMDALPDGQDAIPADHHVFAYAERAGIPPDFLELAWRWFESRYRGEAKRYKDWPAVFRKAVEGNWGRLWAIDAEGTYYLATPGKQLAKAQGVTL